MVHKHRNAKRRACLFKRIRIDIHIRRDHRDVPVPIALFPHQTADCLSGILSLPPRIPRLVESDRPLRAFFLSVLICAELLSRIAEQL